MFFRTALFCGLLSIAASSAYSQILDDTTRQLYNATTTRYFQEDDLRYNRDTTYFLDTTLDHKHEISWVDKMDKKYQNLGVIGTALHPVYPRLPDQIGARSGYDAYTPLYRGGRQLRHYDTRSPYSNLNAIFGERARNLLDVTFTRNVTPRWNVGGDLRTFFIAPQFGGTLARGTENRNVFSYQYDIFSSYSTKDGKYWALGTFSRWNHTVNESGGVDTTGLADDELGYYEELQAAEYLDNTYSQDLRQQYRLYQEYRFSKLFQVFYIFERYRQNNYFYSNLSGSSDYFDAGPYIHTDSTKDRFIYRYTMNEVGLKGSLGKAFYSIGYKRRDGVAPYKYLDYQPEFRENYLVGYGRLAFSPQHEVSLRGELLLDGPYKVDIHYRNRWLSFEAHRRLYQPSLLEQRYFGNHDEWWNDFENILADQFKLAFRLKTGPVVWKPRVEATLLQNLVYWNEEQVPVQAANFGQVITAGGEVDFNLGNWHWNNEVLYTLQSGSARQTQSLPELFVRSEAFFQGQLLGEALYMKTGIGFTTWSQYYRYGYDPVVQQFFLQQSQASPGWYPIVDVFTVLNIGSANIIGRYNHVNSNLFEQPGYLTTAGYPGLPRRFDLGVQWNLFN